MTLGGTGKETGKRHPTIGNNVRISAGAKIIGSFTVGDNSKIGAGSVVIEEVPPNCTVVGVPGRVVKRDNIGTPQDDMDQVHLPDPVKEDITVLQHENAELVNRVLDLEKEVRILERGEPERHRNNKNKKETENTKVENKFKFYNTLTRNIDTVIPHEDGKIAMYTCGPTAYHYAHIGNLRK